MDIPRSIRSSIITATILLAGAIVTNPVMADPVTIQLGSLSGTVDPITYTIADGTFTTSIITLTLNMSSASFFTIDEDTGVITAHTVIDVFFNDGRGNDLSGTFVIDEIGMLGPQPILMEITNGVLSGAGEFSGTRLFGHNPTFPDPGFNCFGWHFSPPDSPAFIFLDLPPDFINGDSLPIHGDCEGCAVPEPTSLVLLGTGLAGIVMKMRQRLRSNKRG
jgi:hypothetical protein